MPWLYFNVTLLIILWIHQSSPIIILLNVWYMILHGQEHSDYTNILFAVGCVTTFIVMSKANIVISLLKELNGGSILSQVTGNMSFPKWLVIFPRYKPDFLILQMNQPIHLMGQTPTMMDCLSNIKKPHKLSVKKFVQCIKKCSSMLNWCHLEQSNQRICC